MATKKNTRPKAARLRLTATETMLRAAKAAEAGDLQAAYDAAQSAVVATNESIALHHQWPEWEQGKLDTILRGGAPTESEAPLGELFCGPSPAEARDRCQRALGWFDATVGGIDSRSSGAKKKAQTLPAVKFNGKVERALKQWPGLPKFGTKGQSNKVRCFFRSNLKLLGPSCSLKEIGRWTDVWIRKRLAAVNRPR